MGVPVGQTMLPVTGAFTEPRSRAWLGVPEAQTNAADVTLPVVPPDAIGGKSTLPVGSIDNLDAVAARNPLIAAMTNSGVLRASQQEKDTLNRMRQQGAPGSRSTRDIAAQAPGVMAANQAQQYDQIGNRMAQDENARQIAIQREVNQGVMAQQQGRENIARIGAEGRVRAVQSTGDSRVAAVQAALPSKEKIAADNIAATKDIAATGNTSKEKIAKAVQDTELQKFKITGDIAKDRLAFAEGSQALQRKFATVTAYAAKLSELRLKATANNNSDELAEINKQYAEVMKVLNEWQAPAAPAAVPAAPAASAAPAFDAKAFPKWRDPSKSLNK
jgi:hypothetical protein